jgi:hypothetical protein
MMCQGVTEYAINPEVKIAKATEILTYNLPNRSRICKQCTVSLLQATWEVDCLLKLALKFTGAEKLSGLQCRSKQVRKCPRHGTLLRVRVTTVTETLVILINNVILAAMEDIVKFLTRVIMCT